MKPKKIRVHFEDKGQDLIHLDIEVFNGGKQGIISDICSLAPPPYRTKLLHKGVLMVDIEAGKVFQYADPLQQFKVFYAGVTIKEISEITE